MITEITGNIVVQKPIPSNISARGKLHGMHVAFKGTWDSETIIWTVLDRHPDKGYWWLHRRDGDAWLTTHARYSELVQVIDYDALTDAV